MAESEWGPHDWSVLAPRRFTGMAAYLIAHWTFCWGSAWDWKGRMYVEAQHRAANGRPKVNWGHTTEAY